MTQPTPQGSDTAYLTGFQEGMTAGLSASEGVTQDYRTLRDATILLSVVAYGAVAWLVWIYVRRYLKHAR